MLTDEIANALVPKDLPEMSLSEAATDRLERDQDRDGDFRDEKDDVEGKEPSRRDENTLSKRILYWNDLLQQIIGENRYRMLDYLGKHPWHSERGYPHLENEGIYFSTGFVELPKRLYADGLAQKSRKQTPYIFGASLIGLEKHIDLSGRSPFIDLGEFDMRLKGLPLILEKGSSRYFSTPNLIDATSTCWASCAGWLVLTAAHTFNWVNHGQNVTLEGGVDGNVHAVANYPIDGALVHIDQNPPQNIVRITPEPCPQPNEPYEFYGMKSKTVSGNVTTVSVLPGVTSSMEPARVRLDTGGQPGDSGALVRSLKTGNGLSIYSGVIDTNGQTYQISQGLDQVANVFSIDLWE
ncbi:hypothetical protein [Pseudooceanicola marinus]|uniref:hypothetical protein n=1 Tax=Pseudooceanicola marinus TaxID=396013 RepID=UPI001CD1D26C|nr:hypothetical protein [Pseudooceanicola marinus]MCA1336886.1 hypothetical protein [Pseudooceanicola marinus]